MKKLLACLPLATLAAFPAFAGLSDYIPSGVQFGGGLSVTTGVNGFIGYANKNMESFWWKRLGMRADFASTKLLKSTINSAIDNYMGDVVDIGDNLTITDGTIESKHFAALVDFFPFGDMWFLGGWRITGGYVFGKMNVDALLTGGDDRLNQFAGKEFQLGDTKYRYNGGDVHGTANAKWAFHGPYAGTGFDIGIYHGFKIYMDAGVVFTNKSAELALNIPEQSALEYKIGGGAWQPISGVPEQLTSDINKTIADAQKELDKYKFFPMIKIGFMYRF